MRNRPRPFLHLEGLDESQINKPFRHKWKGLFVAIWNQDKEALLKALNRKFVLNVDAPRAINDAVNEGWLEGVKILIDHGADPFAEDEYGWNAMHDAILEGNKAIVEFLLDLGLHVNSRDYCMRTPLIDASGKPEPNPDVVELLILRGAKLHARDVWGNTALHEAATFNGIDCVKVLLKHGADPTLRNRRKRTPREAAQWQLDFHICEAAEDGLNPDESDYQVPLLREAIRLLEQAESHLHSASASHAPTDSAMDSSI